MTFSVDDDIEFETRTGEIKIHGPEGFEGMRKAGLLAAQCLDMLIPHVKPGVLTSHLDDLAREFILERGALPELEGMREETRRADRILLSRRPGLRDGGPDDGHVDGVRLQPHAVAVAVALERVGVLAEVPAQAGDVAVQCPPARLRGRLWPDGVDQRVDRDGAPVPHHHQGDHGTAPRTRDDDRHAVDDEPKWPQHVDAHA